MSTEAAKPKSKTSKKKTHKSDEMEELLAKKDDEISQLNELIRQLTLENNKLLKKVVSSPVPKPAIRKKSSIARPLDSLTPTRRNSSTKGCSCKGNCSSKICGCVKKEQPCTEACKCPGQCDNSLDDNVFDEDKENAVDSKQEEAEEQDEEEEEIILRPARPHKITKNVTTTAGKKTKTKTQVDVLENKENQLDSPEDGVTNRRAGRFAKKIPTIRIKKPSRINSSSTSDASTLDSPIVVETDEEESPFNPMKPTRTLPRSPVASYSLPATTVNTLRAPKPNKTMSPLDEKPIKTRLTGKSASPKVPKAPKDSEEYPCPTVNWDQHQNRLLPCSKCGRKFWPDRLPIHEKACLKI